MTQKDEQLATESVGKLLLKLSIPTITAQLVNALYNMVDRMYIGHIEGIGANALTGIGLTMPIIMLISACAYLFCIGGAPRASIMMGRGKPEEAEKILGSCTLGTIVAAIILTVIFLIFGERLLWMFGASENTLPYAMSYMRIYVCGTIFVQLALGLNAFITAQGFTKISMLSVLIGAVCNIVLDPLFIFVFRMGVSGAAIATVISQGISAVWVVSFLMGRRAHIRLRLSNLRMRLANLSALYCLRTLSLCHAVHGEPAQYLLQLFALQIWRRPCRRSHGHSLQCYAADLSSLIRHHAGCSAYHQL